MIMPFNLIMDAMSICLVLKSKQQGTYTIVSVNGQGQPSIIEPAYQPK